MTKIYKVIVAPSCNLVRVVYESGTRREYTMDTQPASVRRFCVSAEHKQVWHGDHIRHLYKEHVIKCGTFYNRVFVCRFRNKYGFMICSIRFAHINSMDSLFRQIDWYKRNITECTSFELVEV